MSPCVNLSEQYNLRELTPDTLTQRPPFGLIRASFGHNGQIAQSVEQGIENPCVGGSIPPLATNVFCAQRKITADSVFANGENHERHPPPSNTTCVNELPRFHRIAATDYAPRSGHQRVLRKAQNHGRQCFRQRRKSRKAPPHSNTTCVNELPRFHRIAATDYAPRSGHQRVLRKAQNHGRQCFRQRRKSRKAPPPSNTTCVNEPPPFLMTRR